MVEREWDFPDGRMQKLMGKSWASWNLPEQPTELDLRKLRDAYMPPDQYRVHHQSTPLPPRYMPLFGTHPDSDFLSITTCPACGWLMKMQHANKHFLRDSRGAIVCKESDLAIFGSKVLGKACHPVGELKETFSKKITLRLLPPPHKTSSHALRGSSINEMLKSRSSGSHTSKTDYYSHSSSHYRSRSHSQMLHPPVSSHKGRSSTSSTHSYSSINSSSKGKSGKSHTSTSSSWSSLRSPPPKSQGSSSHKPSVTSGSYTLSIPSEDMGQNESVEDLLMSNISHPHGSSKHTVHIIATSNSGKSKAADPDYDRIKFYSDVPDKRLKLDSSHSRSTDHHHKSSSELHGLYSKSSSKDQLKHRSSSSYNGAGSSHLSSSDSSKKSKSSSSLSKNDSGSSNKHHLRSTTSSSIVALSTPSVSIPSLSSKSHSVGSAGSSSTTDKEKSSSSKKKKRKRDKDEPRKIIPLKDRDFNPDKHCGVTIQGSNVPCKRSLTCKTHSVALRRAVVGRSQSFDALLAAHKLAKSEEKGSQSSQTPSQPKPKEVVEEVAQVTPPKPKKKKPSGSTSTIGSSPNDLRPLAGVPESISYGRSRSPDIEVLEVRSTKPAPIITKPKPIKSPPIEVNPKKFKPCPLVYPYLPESQNKFERVWYNPSTMDRTSQITETERSKFTFLLKHYKNPYYVNSEVSQPLAKNVREKRNVFSNWNASEKPEGSTNTNWTQEGRRQNAIVEVDDEVQCMYNDKKS